MTDLLQPQVVRRLLVEAESSAARLKKETQNLKMDFSETIQAMSPRLCRDYLTLWADREELLDDLADVREELEELRR